MRRPLALCLPALLAGSPGCSSNVSGDLEALTTGDLSSPLRDSGDPVRALADTCGTEPMGASVLRRRPYVQQLTDQSASVLWTAAAEAPPMTVRLTSAEGRLLGEAQAIQDATARPPELARQWTVSFGGLEPDTTYCYELRSNGRAVRRAGFHTAPRPGTRTVRFVAFGDSGDGSADQRAVLDRMRGLPFEFLIHVGDLAYHQGTRAEFERNYFRVYADVLEQFSLFPASGNHEYDTEDAAPFREAFALPENGGPSGRERWYSFDWGHVHFAVLDTERIGPEQIAWLDADLAGNRQPWTIVYGHRPPFSSGSHGSNEAVQRAFVPLLKKHRVPLMLAGHDHHYERTVPIDGVTYVITGGGGVGTRGTGRSSFTAFSESVLQFLYVTVSEDTLTTHAIDATGIPFDSLVLQRPDRHAASARP